MHKSGNCGRYPYCAFEKRMPVFRIAIFMHCGYNYTHRRLHENGPSFGHSPLGEMGEKHARKRGGPLTTAPSSAANNRSRPQLESKIVVVGSPPVERQQHKGGGECSRARPFPGKTRGGPDGRRLFGPPILGTRIGITCKASLSLSWLQSADGKKKKSEKVRRVKKAWRISIDGMVTGSLLCVKF